MTNANIILVTLMYYALLMQNFEYVFHNLQITLNS